MATAAVWVVLAPTAPGVFLPGVRLDATRRVDVDGDAWTVLTDTAEIRRALAATDPQPTGPREVLAALQLAGYWPTSTALYAYDLEP